MKWLLGIYTGRFNRRHRESGHLFSGRYKARFVEGSGKGYLKTVCDYVHLNPVRAKLVRGPQKLLVFPWSSYPAYLKARGARPPWLRVDRLLGEHGIQKDSESGRGQFEKRMEARRIAEQGEDPEAEPPGWYVGSEAFRKELLAQMKAGPEHFGEEVRESAEKKAERLIKEELKALGWREAGLEKRRKGDPAKVRIALRLRQETTMTLEWVAQRLHMGAKAHLSHLLYWRDRDKKKKRQKRT
jgi:hypothetical protein